MAARGTVAKENITRQLREVLGKDFIGEFDKKIYVWANDGGERVQIAISMTCPKTPIEIDKTVDVGGDWDWGGGSVNNTVAVSNAPPPEITEEETKNIADLMARLGL